jgi:hypothetical protein
MATDDLEKAFASTTSVLFGAPLFGIGRYGGWLDEYAKGAPLKAKSALSGKPLLLTNLLFHLRIKDNSIRLDEFETAGRRSIGDRELGALSLSNAAELLKEIKMISPEAIIEPNIAVEDCAFCYTSSNCYKSLAVIQSKFCAYSFWPRESEYAFGCRYLFSSMFCVRCYHSQKLTRCFEVEGSTGCSDCYFCHNCENVQESMFCFNAKGLRHAIGNRELGREKYMEIKKRVLGGIYNHLEKEKRLEPSIYNIGCGKNGHK